MPIPTSRSAWRMRSLLALACVAVAAALAPPASAASLDCSGATIYAVQRPGGAPSPATNGVVYALAANTVGSSSVTATQLTTLPSGSWPNSLGITGDGSAMYAIQQAGNPGSAMIWGYSAASGTWTSYVGTGGTPSNFVAGAVDPVNGIFYYADYANGSNFTPGTATLYGFNTTTNTAIPGVIAKFNLPDGPSAAGQNGDIAFDQQGNLYVLASTGSVRALGVVKGPLPTAGSTNGATLTDTTLSSVSDSSTYNGIAFDNNGRLYMESQSGTTSQWQITVIDPNSGNILSGPTPLSANAQGQPDVDLASCATIPTLTAQTNVTGRVNPSDQFTMTITGGTITGGNTATTSGTATGIQPQTAGPVVAAGGTTYTVSETAASGNLADYQVSYSCVDTSNGNASVASGTGSSFQLNFPSSSGASPAVMCTFTTTPLADLAVTDSVSPQNVNQGGQVTYTLIVTNNGPGADSSVQLTDAMPSGVSIVSAATSQGTCSITGGLSCAIGSLPSGSSAQVVVVANVAANAPLGAATDNAATTGAAPDPNLANNSASSTIQIASPPPPPSTGNPPSGANNPPSNPPAGTTPGTTPTSTPPKVDIQIAIHPGPPGKGHTLTYNLVVTNGGPATAPNTVIRDTTLTGLRVVKVGSGGAKCPRKAINCQIPSLAPGQKVTIKVTVVRTGNGPTGLSVEANPGCSSDGTCPEDVNLQNNTATTSRPARPYLTLTQAAKRAVIKAGQFDILRLKVTNPTGQTLDHVRVCDRLPLGLVYTHTNVPARLISGRLCWNLAKLDPGQTKVIRVLVKGLRVAVSKLTAKGTAAANGTGTARADASVRVLAAPAPGPTVVTG